MLFIVTIRFAKQLEFYQYGLALCQHVEELRFQSSVHVFIERPSICGFRKINHLLRAVELRNNTYFDWLLFIVC